MIRTQILRVIYYYYKFIFIKKKKIRIQRVTFVLFQYR